MDPHFPLTVDLLGAKFDNSRLEGAYLSGSISDAASIQGADFTDAQMPDFARKKLCNRPDINVENKITGTTTSESLFCE
jgi:uncharacterized protein YjbI with pentapeptide repeats